MDKPEIILVSNKSEFELAPLRADLDGYCWEHDIIMTCRDASAAINRNYGLDRATSSVVIMIDDDTSGFYWGWIDDLVYPFKDRSIMMVSARLMTPEGCCAGMMFGSNNLEQPVEDVEAIPTACCAMRNMGFRFDERFIGSGFEDTEASLRLRQIYPDHRIVINNKCKIIHKNVMQNQHGAFYEHNRKLFREITKHYKMPKVIPMGLDIPEDPSVIKPKEERIVIR